MNKRKSYSKEFKLEALRLLESSDLSTSQLAIKLGVRRNQLYQWKSDFKQHGDDAFSGSGRPPLSASGELAQLRKELAEVKQERDILKKAAAYFARELK